MIDKQSNEGKASYSSEMRRRNPRPGTPEFAGVGSDTCDCGACGHRIPDDDMDTRNKILRYRQKHGLV